MFCSRKKDVKHPKWVEWCKKSEEEQSEIAEKNGWFWYFDWLETGDIIRYKYEKADTDPKVANKYGGYDRWYETHKKGHSYAYVGIDGSINESKQPIREWTIFNPCTNKNCPYNQGEYANQNECGYFGSNEQQYDCFNDLFASIQAFIDVCGEKDLNKLAKDFKIHKDIIGWFKYGDKYFKGDDKMSKPFWVALSELKGGYDDISVFWTENTMYVNDKNDGQATINITLFQAYRFASLIQTPNFDYVATDEEVKELQKQLLEFYRDDFSEEEQHQYIVDVWEYLDDIADDFFKLTGVKINNIDFKRAIVCYMSETDWENECAMGFGSGTYIARLLSDYILGDTRHNIKGCNNSIAIKLANEYLQSDHYDVRSFAQALHKECEHTMQMPKTFNEFLIQSQIISEKCYYLLGYFIKNNISYNNDILVGYINWFGDYDINERYIYCHIDSDNNQIYFKENRESNQTTPYLHDIAFPHLVFDQNRIQKDIEIKLTDTYIEDMLRNIPFDYQNDDENWAYIHCHMYNQAKGSFS